MKLLENRILRDARVLSDDVLDVDCFLGGMKDLSLLSDLANEFYRIFSGEKITKVVCSQDAGAVLPAFVAKLFEVPSVCAWKVMDKMRDRDVYVGKVVSYTRSEVYDLFIPRKYISSSDKVLIISTFISRGNETLALIDMLRQSGCELCGVCCAVEKGFLPGADLIRSHGVRVESLARIESMSASNGIRFYTD